MWCIRALHGKACPPLHFTDCSGKTWFFNFSTGSFVLHLFGSCVAKKGSLLFARSRQDCYSLVTWNGGVWWVDALCAEFTLVCTSFWWFSSAPARVHSTLRISWLSLQTTLQKLIRGMSAAAANVCIYWLQHFSTFLKWFQGPRFWYFLSCPWNLICNKFSECSVTRFISKRGMMPRDEDKPCICDAKLGGGGVICCFVWGVCQKQAP